MLLDKGEGLNTFPSETSLKLQYRDWEKIHHRGVETFPANWRTLNLKLVQSQRARASLLFRVEKSPGSELVAWGTAGTWGKWKANGKGVAGNLSRKQLHPHHWITSCPHDLHIKLGIFFGEGKTGSLDKRIPAWAKGINNSLS